MGYETVFTTLILFGGFVIFFSEPMQVCARLRPTFHVGVTASGTIQQCCHHPSWILLKYINATPQNTSHLATLAAAATRSFGEFHGLLVTIRFLLPQKKP
jgi:hypothetical protein